MKKIKLAKINPETACREIGDFIIQNIIESGRVGGIIGLSGGVDSTTTAALAKKAFDSCKEKQLELVGYILPSNANFPKDKEDGVKVAERLGIRYEIVNIEPVVRAFANTNPLSMNSKYHKGNLMSEIRAVILHQKAATENKLLLGTGNRDEDFEIGYYTLFGDGAVHLSPIGNLPKRLVRELACYLGFPDLANRTPTAGLYQGQTDFKDLGYDYDLTELVGEGLKQGFSHLELAVHPQVKLLAEKQIHQYEFEFKYKKFQNAQEIMKDIMFRREVAEAKSEIIHPPTAPVTLNYNNGEKNGL
ncbi:MAG: NAD(+) synthase [archaeon]